MAKETQDQLTSCIREIVHPIVINFVIDEVGPYIDNLQESLERIQNLGLAATTMSNDTSEDALRASVVLLHASLEDFPPNRRRQTPTERKRGRAK